MCVNFFVVHYAPGNPVSEILSQEDPAFNVKNPFKTFLFDEDIITKLKADFELDQPLPQRFFSMLKRYARFDFGYSYFKGEKVSTLIKKSFPLSFALGIMSTILTYCLAIPLGIMKARYFNSRFDIFSTFILGGVYAIPPFATAILLIVLVGNYVPIYASAENFPWFFIIPVSVLVLYNLVKPTLLMKNSLLEEFSKPYVMIVRAKGASEQYILWRHCFKNSFLVTISSFSYVFLFTFFFGTLVIEFLFSINGLGYLSYEATINRDYPVILACLYVYALFGLLCHILTDWIYSILDKRVRLNHGNGH